jgi:hypothetical protein
LADSFVKDAAQGVLLVSAGAKPARHARPWAV